MSNKKEALIIDNQPITEALSYSSHLKQYKHYIFPGFNTHIDTDLFCSIEDAVNFYQSPPAIIRKPLPCLSATYIQNREDSRNGDSVLKLVKEKLSWNKNHKYWKNLARKSLRNCEVIETIKSDLEENKRITSLPYIIARLADHKAKNPDKYFDGVYNWYYGSAIATVNISDQACLLFAGGKQLNEFCFSFYNRPSSTDDTVPKIFPKMKISLAEDTAIYDIVPGKDCKSVGIRQRNYCYFYLFNDENEDISLNQCLKVKRQEYPFVSMDSCVNEFTTVNSNRQIKCWTPDTSKDCCDVFTLPESNAYLPDTFAQIKYLSNKGSEQFVVIDRRKLYYYDKRVDRSKPISIQDPAQSIELCEDISLLVPSVVDNYLYLGLTHSCLLFDVRARFVQKWTHMLPQSPCVGSTFQINKSKNQPKECLLLGTQSTNDIVAIYNTWKGDVSKSHVLPVNVPVRIDTLYEARCNGLLVDPSITKKFSRSLVGMASYKKKKRIGVFTISCTGDIFHQTVQRLDVSSCWNPDEQTQLQESQLNHLKLWESDYLQDLKKQKNSIKITRQVDLSCISEIISSNNHEIPPHPKPDLRGKAVWKKSKKTLESFHDFLTPHILHDFGLDEESEWGSDTEEQSTRKTVPSSINKVSSWLSTVNVGQTEDVIDIDELFVPEVRIAEGDDMDEDIEDYIVSVSSDESVGRVSRLSYGTS